MYNRLPYESAKAVAEFLKTNKLITKLSLSNIIYKVYNIIDRNKIRNEGVKVIAESLKINQSITELNLGNINNSSYYR